MDTYEDDNEVECIRAKERDERKFSLGWIEEIEYQLSDKNTENIKKFCGVVTRNDRDVKPAKAPTWTKILSMEMFVKQMEIWEEINSDVP